MSSFGYDLGIVRLGNAIVGLTQWRQGPWNSDCLGGLRLPGDYNSSD